MKSAAVSSGQDEETKLFGELAEPGDWDEARENVARRLIEGHLAQVVSIAQKHSASSAPMLDLIPEGNIGLMSAVRNFAERPIATLPTTPPLALMTQSRKLLGSRREKSRIALTDHLRRRDQRPHQSRRRQPCGSSGAYHTTSRGGPHSQHWQIGWAAAGQQAADDTRRHTVVRFQKELRPVSLEIPEPDYD